MKTATLWILTLTSAALLTAACGSGESSSSAPAPKETGPAAAAPAATAPATDSRFRRTLGLQGVSFTITCDNDSSINQLSIVPTGLEGDNSPISQDVDGTVTGAEVGDLDVDGSPEVYVYVQSAGSGSYGSLVAYAVNKRKSLSAIYLPPVTENEKAARGYMGHDAFAVVENRLVQRFPVYRDGDANANPTGGTRQLQYKLVAGEAGWKLVVDRVVEY
jgi:hypothetical protein